MLKLFDKTFFKMTFIFLSIILVGFIFLLIIGYFDMVGQSMPNLDKNNLAKTAGATTTDLTP